MLQDVIQARPLLWMLVKRELKTRYAGSNLGAFWNVINPVIVIAIYVVVFSRLMGGRVGAGGDESARFSYAIHLCAGIIPWFLFSEIISRCANVLTENANLLKKMPLAEEVLYLSVFFTSLIVHGFSMVALIVLLWLMGASLSPMVLFAFPIMVVLGLAALGIGMVLSVMTLLVRDVGQFVNNGLLLMFWSLPIVYPSTILGDRIDAIMRLNPFRGYFTLTQLLFDPSGTGFHSDAYYTMALLPFFALAVGIVFVRTNKSEILDAL